MIKIGKKHNCIVIVNSSDATDQYLKYLDNGADFIIQGEGELTLNELISSLKNKSSVENINGIIYKKK